MHAPQTALKIASAGSSRAKSGGRRVAKDASKVNSDIEVETVHEAIREFLDMPDTKGSKKAQTAADVLDRYLLIKEALDALEGWERPGAGGYQFPEST